jgi:hypothetical protein
MAILPQAQEDPFEDSEFDEDEAPPPKPMVDRVGLTAPLILMVLGLFAVVLVVWTSVAYADSASRGEYSGAAIAASDSMLQLEVFLVEANATTVELLGSINRLEEGVAKLADLTVVPTSDVAAVRDSVTSGAYATARAQLKVLQQRLLEKLKAAYPAAFYMSFRPAMLLGATGTGKALDVAAASNKQIPDHEDARVRALRFATNDQARAEVVDLCGRFLGDSKAAFDSFSATHAAATQSVVAQLTVDRTNINALATQARGIQKQTDATLKALNFVMEHLHRDFKSKTEVSSGSAALKLTLYVIVACVSIVGAAFAMWVLGNYKQTVADGEIIRHDFTVSPADGRVQMADSTVRSLSEHCAHFSVMSTAVAESEEPGQIELNLQRCKGTLATLRSFIPPFAFMQHASVDAFGVQLPRLNMNVGLVKDFKCAMLYIGLRSLNHSDADVSSFSAFFEIVHRCVERWGGVVAQTGSGAMLALFVSHGTDDGDDEPDMPIETEICAAHAAFGIGVNASVLHAHDNDDDGPPPVSMVVLSGTALHGVQQSHASASYLVVSPMVNIAKHLEVMNEKFETLILTDSKTAELLDESVLSRPIALSQELGTTVCELVMEQPAVADADNAGDYKRHKERLIHWRRAWDKYEEAIETMAPDKLEDAFKALESHRQCFMIKDGVAQRDVAIDSAIVFVRRSLLDLGVAIEA